MDKLYTTKYINAISFILSIIVFFSICFIHKQIRDLKIPTTQDTIKVQFYDGKVQNTVIEEPNKQTKENVWHLKIPSISLEANIAEGTLQETMNTKIGHFEETSRMYGNIGLAAHNRGYPVNYFANLKLLKKGDVIQYQYQNFQKEYVVTSNRIIQDTDWTNLEETQENTITLITCVEDEPQFRRCVTGKEKIETQP